MPNWCRNEITITGKPKMLNKLLKQIERTKSEATEESEATPFDFEKVLPMPSGVDWYDWRVNNWGTKWNACDFEWCNDEWESGEVLLSFNTAWSPPTPVLEALSAQNPKVVIDHRFTEEGWGFYGHYKYQAGYVELIDEGEFKGDTPCETYMEYFGDSSHHYCNECDEFFECEGIQKTSNELCSECKVSVLNDEEQLWEGEANDDTTLLHNQMA